MRDQILERAGGNPLFIEEIVRGLIERGVLKREGQQWRIAAGEAATGIPATIQAMLLARVDRLPQEVRRLAQEAAVIGPRFDAALLKAVTADPGRLEAGSNCFAMRKSSRKLPDAGSVSSQSYRFTQTLLQDVIYQNLLLQRRTDMHGRIGAAFERLCGDKPERLEDLTVLGHHFSSERASARRARITCGRPAIARALIYANDDALRFYEQALRALAAIGQTPLRLADGERIADLCGPAGRREIAHEHYETVLQAYREPATASLRRGSCARSAGCSGTPASATRPRSRYAEAAALLDGADAPIEQAHLLAGARPTGVPQRRSRSRRKMGGRGA